MTPNRGEIYRHYKNDKLYCVIDVAPHTETGEMMVVYRRINKTPRETWVRPLSVWNEVINGKPRFTKIGGKNDKKQSRT